MHANPRMHANPKGACMTKNVNDQNTGGTRMEYRNILTQNAALITRNKPTTGQVDDD